MAKLGSKIKTTNVKAQKMNIFTFKTFEIVLTSFYFDDKLRKIRFF